MCDLWYEHFIERLGHELPLRCKLRHNHPDPCCRVLLKPPPYPMCHACRFPMYIREDRAHGMTRLVRELYPANAATRLGQCTQQQVLLGR